MEQQTESAVNLFKRAFEAAEQEGLRVFAWSDDDGLLEVIKPEEGWCAYNGGTPWSFWREENDAHAATVRSPGGNKKPLLCLLLKGDDEEMYY
jgi:hypothetical protein